MGRLTFAAILHCLIAGSLDNFVACGFVIKSKPVQRTDKLPQETLEELNVLEAVEISKVNIKPKKVVEAESITFPNGDTLIRHGIPKDLPDGFVNVDFMDEADGEADISVNIKKGIVEGSLFSSDGTTYLIKNVGQRGIAQLWVKVPPEPMSNVSDVVLTPPERNPEERLWTDGQRERLLARALNDDSMADISVKVYYTKEYEWATPDLDGTLDRIFAVTNQGFENSGIKIRLNKLCQELYKGSQLYDGSAMLSSMWYYKTPMSNLLGSADIAILMTRYLALKSHSPLINSLPNNSTSNVGGIAYLASTGNPIGMVTKRGAEEGFVFGHEVAHILGGDHDRLQIGKEGRTPIVNYGVAYLIPGTNKATILAYATTQHSRYINYYSGPSIIDAEGDATGTFNANNAKIMNDRRFLYPEIGDESQGCEVDIGGDSCHTEGGSKCIFPFTYKGSRYGSCTSAESDRPWCATLTDDAGNQVERYWGYCDVGTCKMACNTRAGKVCVFPFEYEGTTYNQCTSANANENWCATDVGPGDAYNGSWDYCGANCG